MPKNPQMPNLEVIRGGADFRDESFQDLVAQLTRYRFPIESEADLATKYQLADDIRLSLADQYGLRGIEVYASGKFLLYIKCSDGSHIEIILDLEDVIGSNCSLEPQLLTDSNEIELGISMDVDASTELAVQHHIGDPDAMVLNAMFRPRFGEIFFERTPEKSGEKKLLHLANEANMRLADLFATNAFLAAEASDQAEKIESVLKIPNKYLISSGTPLDVLVYSNIVISPDGSSIITTSTGASVPIVGTLFQETTCPERQQLLHLADEVGISYPQISNIGVCLKIQDPKLISGKPLRNIRWSNSESNLARILPSQLSYILVPIIHNGVDTSTLDF